MANYNGMPMPMGPPMIPGYSLRVQLFAPNSHSAQDTPIRCFRVVTSPDSTLEEFCREASRIHAINYGEPISIKKCQDDQMFDVTQSDLLGPIFTNAATIRVIQASSMPNIRDSVPPTSALRYNPLQMAGKKRVRSPSVELNGTATPPARRNSKRQRVAEFNPDHPLPSLEEDAEIVESENEGRTDLVIPDSQPSGSMTQDEAGDKQRTTATRHSAGVRSKPALASPYIETIRPQSSGTHSMSYHIPRVEERGTSVSTAATTPLSADPQLDFPGSNVASAVAAAFKPQASDIHSSAQNGNKSPNEDSLYENVPSDDEGPALLRKTKAAALKARKSPKAGLPGLTNTNGLNTPTNQNRRSSKDSPITPASSARKNSNEVNASENSHQKARNTAADAAVKRQAGEREHIAESKKMAEDKAAEKEQQSTLKAEKEAVEKKRLQEQAARKRDAEETRLRSHTEKKLEDQRIAEVQQAEKTKLAMKAKLDEELRVEEERLALKRRSEERQEAERRKWNAALANGDSTLKTLRQRSASLSEKRSSSPQLTRAQQSPLAKSPTPLFKTPNRPQSSTPHIPRGRKPAIKSSSVPNSSPELSKTSPEVERRGVGIEDQLPIPPPHKRRVSFALDEEQTRPPSVASKPKVSPAVSSIDSSSQKAATPIRSSQVSAILPPKTLNSRTATPGRPLPKAVASAKKSAPGDDSARKPSTPIPVPSVLSAKVPLKMEVRHSTTPVLPPAPLSKVKSIGPGQERSATPTRGRIVPPSNVVKRSPVVEIPARIVSKSPASSVQKQVTPAKGNSDRAAESPRSSQSIPQKAKTVEISSDEDEMSSDEESDELPRDAVATSSAQIFTPARSSVPKSVEDVEMTDAKATKDDESNQSQDEEDLEMESAHSSPRQSHSPISFNPNTSTQNSGFKPIDVDVYQVPLPEATVSEDEALQKASSDFGEEIKGANVDSSEKESESDENMEEERTTQPVRKTPSISPQKTQRTSPTYPTSPSSLSTQAEVDLQLTSSFHEVIRSSPPLTTSAKPPISHIMKNGASLKSLHSNRRSLVISSSQVTKPTVNGSQYALKALQQQEDEESSEEDDDSSDTDSDSSDELPAPAPTQKRTTQSSDSDSDSSDESEGVSKKVNVATKKKQTVNGGNSRKAGKDMKGKKDYTRNAAFNFRGF
ncbi:hypothetical protein BP5796_09193 [Coleophoma crateriformis]|uniref:Nucleolar protein Dnt1-like N-terminal domain-containing protein n=1 Tax=Coleophoma crateriformis TaxID=565419 RepID=A0A3D8R3H4_9HELO|nr:hypothetical protein BP5796_09193 [Coleophoma crateriformis]